MKNIKTICRKEFFLHRKRLKARKVNTNKVILGDDEQRN